MKIGAEISPPNKKQCSSLYIIIVRSYKKILDGFERSYSFDPLSGKAENFIEVMNQLQTGMSSFLIRFLLIRTELIMKRNILVLRL